MTLRDRMPPGLLNEFLGMELWQWLSLALLLLASTLLTGFARSIVGTITNRFGLKEKLAHNSVKGLKLACSIVLLVALWWLFLPYLELPDFLLRIINFLLILGSVLGGALLIIAAFDAVLDASAVRASELVNRADHILIPIARKLGKFIILVTAALIFAASVGVNVAGVIAGLGITGLLFALAAKDSVENIFGSITILFDMPFGIGDRIKTSNVEGVVEQINLRSTRIRTSTDSLITLPNSNLIKASVENFGSRRYRPVIFKLLLSYSNPQPVVEAFGKGVREIVTQDSKVRSDNAYVHLHELNENHLGVLVEFQIITDDYPEELELREAILSRILAKAKETGVVLGALPWMPVDSPELQRTQNQTVKVAEA